MAAKTERFTARIEWDGKRRLIRIPFDPNTVWGEKQRHHVRGSIAHHPFRGPLQEDERGFFLLIGPAWWREKGLADDAEVLVELSPEGVQFDDLAPDVAAALGAEPEAKAFFEGLATFYRNGYIRWIEGAKRPETRAARIREFLACLKAGKKSR